MSVIGATSNSELRRSPTKVSLSIADWTEASHRQRWLKVKGKETYSSLQAKPAITATGTHLPYGITQCYLPPGRGDIPAYTPAKAGGLEMVYA